MVTNWGSLYNGYNLCSHIFSIDGIWWIHDHPPREVRPRCENGTYGYCQDSGGSDLGEWQLPTQLQCATGPAVQSMMRPRAWEGKTWCHFVCHLRVFQCTAPMFWHVLVWGADCDHCRYKMIQAPRREIRPVSFCILHGQNRCGVAVTNPSNSKPFSVLQSLLHYLGQSTVKWNVTAILR